ncbi:MAG: hypothetical protein LBK02_07630 [Treponema sp.]|jgi:hypothetical protein|nr:hypothetical protein [Treponema sp.]
MDFIFDNLGIVVFVVIAIGARIVQARAKAAARREKEAPQVFASSLEPDDDEEDEPERFTKPDEAEGLINYARTRGASGYTVEKAREKMARLAEEPPRFEALPGLPVNMPPAGRPVGAALPDLPALKPSAAPAPLSAVVPADASPVEERKNLPAPGRPKRTGILFPGLGKLTSLQQAVLWAEIMGKPRGMS